MKDWTPPKDAVVSDDKNKTKKGWTPPKDAVVVKKKEDGGISSKEVESVTPTPTQPIDERLLDGGDNNSDLKQVLENAPKYSTDPIEMEKEKYFSDIKLKEENKKKEQQIKEDPKIYTEHYNKKIDDEVNAINNERVAKGDTPISKEGLIKYRENEYSKEFLSDNIDKTSYEFKNRLEEINNEVENIDKSFENNPAMQILSEKDRNTVKQHQIEKLQKEYTDVESKRNNFESNRISTIDDNIKELSTELMNPGILSSDKEVIAKRIKLLSSQKENFFKDISENTKELAIKGGIPVDDKVDLSDKETFDKYYDALYQEYNDLKSSDIVQSALGNKGIVSETLTTIGALTIFGGNEDLMRLGELKETLEEYAPIRLLNRYTTGQTESLGLIASEGGMFEGVKRFGETFVEGLQSGLTPFDAKSQKAESQSLASDLIGLGITLNENTTTSADVNEVGSFNDYGLTEPEYWGNMSGISSSIMLQMATPVKGSALLKGTGLISKGTKGATSISKILSRTNTLTNLSKTKVIGGLLNKKGINFAKKAIETGVDYQTKGLIFQNNADELSFTSGLYGAVGEGVVTSLLPKSKVFGSVLNKWFSESGTSKIVNAVSTYGNKIASMTGKGVGEVAEEFGQELASIHTEDNADFFNELESRYGTLEKASKFIISSFTMGFLMGGGTLISKTSQESFKKDFESLKKSNPEQAKKVESVIAEMQQEIGSVIEESVDENKKSKLESGEAGYFVMDKEVTKDDVLEKINNAKTPEELNGITILNDSEIEKAHLDKIKELIPIQEQVVEETKPVEQQAEEQPLKEGYKAGETVELSVEPIKTEENAIQEQKTSEVPIQSETTTSEEVEKGTSEPKPITTTEVQETKSEAEVVKEETTPIKEELPTRLQPKSEYVSKSGKQTVKHNKKTGVIEVLNKNGTKPDAKTKRKVIKEYEDSLDYVSGESEFGNPDYEGEGDINRIEKDIVNKTNNPSDLVRIIDERTKRGNEDWEEIGNVDWHIAERLTSISPESLKNNWDANKITPQIRTAYLKNFTSKEGVKDNGGNIDKIAQELSFDAGIEITPEDIVSFIERYPGGKSQFNKKSGDQTIDLAKMRFKELTGLDYSDNILKNVKEQLTEKENKIEYEQAVKEYKDKYGVEPDVQDEAQMQILEELVGNNKKEVISKTETPTTEQQVEEVKTEEKPKGIIPPPPPSPPTKSGKEMGDSNSSNEGKKKFFLSMIDQMDIPNKVKEQLNDNIERAIITNKQAKKIADEYISRFPTPKEAFEAVKGFGSELLQASVGVEVLNTLRAEHTKLKESGADTTNILAIQADIYEVIEGLQDKGADSGRAIQYLSTAKFATSEEVLMEVQKRKIKKLNEEQRIKENAPSINDSDINNIIKDTLNSDEVVSLKNEIEVLKERINKLESNNVEVKKQRAKIKKHKQNINDILFKYKNTPNPLNASIIPGLTSKDVQLAIDLSKEYIGIIGANAKIIAQEVQSHLKSFGKDVSIEDLEKLAEEQIKLSEAIAEEKELNEVVKEAKQKAKALETSIEQLFEDILLGKNEESILNILTNDLGLDINKAKKLKSKIESKLQEKLKQKIQNSIQKKFDGTDVKNKNKKAKNIAEKVVLDIQAGIEFNEAVKSKYNDEFGILNLESEEFINGLKDRVKKVVDSPEGILRNEAEKQLIDWFNNQRKIDWSSVLKTSYYGNILSGYNTHINNIVFGASIVGKEVIKNTFKGFFDSKSWNQNKQIFKSFGIAYDTAINDYKTGISGDVKYETESQKTSGLKRGNDIERTKLAFINSFLKALVAEDSYFTTIVKEGKFADLLYEEALSEEIRKSPDGKVSRSKRKELLRKLNDTMINVSDITKDRVQANKDITKSLGLESPLMVEDNGKFKLSEEYKDRKDRKDLIRKFNIRAFEIRESRLDKDGDKAEKAFEYAKDQILSGTPKGTAGIIYNTLQPILAGSPLLQLLTIPFVKVPVNSARLIVDTTPIFGAVYHGMKMLPKVLPFINNGNVSESTLGLFVTSERLGKLGIESKLSKERANQILTRQIVSTILVATIYATMKGYEDDEKEINPIIDFTGKLSSDYKEVKAYEKSKGLTPYTIYIGGKPIINYLFTPFAGMFNLLGTVRDSERDISKLNTNSTVSKWVLSSLSGSTLAIEQSALTGINKVLTTFKEVTEAGIENMKDSESDRSLSEPILKLLADNVKNLIPAKGLLFTGYSDYKAIFDLNDKESIDVTDRLMKGIPFLDSMLEDKRDYLGEPLKIYSDVGLLRLNRDSEKNYEIMHDVGYDIARKNNNLKSKQTNPYTGEIVELTKEELYNLNTIVQDERKKLFNIKEWEKEYKNEDNYKEIMLSKMKDAHTNANTLGKLKFFEKKK